MDLLPDDDKDGIVADNGLVAALAEVTPPRKPIAPIVGGERRPFLGALSSIGGHSEQESNWR